MAAVISPHGLHLFTFINEYEAHPDEEKKVKKNLWN